MRYDYPGNVRELENILERTLALSSDAQIGKEDLQLPNKIKETKIIIPQDDNGDPPAISSDPGLPLQDFP